MLFDGMALVCAEAQDLSFGLKNSAARKPKKTAAAIPPEAAFRPPVSAPSRPSSRSEFSKYFAWRAASGVGGLVVEAVDRQRGRPGGAVQERSG